MASNKLTTCLWFDKNAQEAAAFYVGIFPNSRVTSRMRAPADTPSAPEGAPLTVAFELDGKPFLGLNGGPHFTFNEAVSFIVDCRDQAEVDRYWEALLAGGGQPSQCGWLKDRSGVSWQVTPRRLMELMQDPDPTRAKRTTEAMMKMVKIDIAELERAAAG